MFADIQHTSSGEEYIYMVLSAELNAVVHIRIVLQCWLVIPFITDRPYWRTDILITTNYKKLRIILFY